MCNDLFTAPQIQQTPSPVPVYLFASDEPGDTDTRINSHRPSSASRFSSTTSPFLFSQAHCAVEGQWVRLLRPTELLDYFFRFTGNKPFSCDFRNIHHTFTVIRPFWNLVGLGKTLVVRVLYSPSGAD